MTQLYAFYSERAAKIFGTVIYLTKDGKPVECTDPAGSEYKWDDKVFVGPVDRFSRSNIFRHGINIFRANGG